MVEHGGANPDAAESSPAAIIIIARWLLFDVIIVSSSLYYSMLCYEVSAAYESLATAR